MVTDRVSATSVKARGGTTSMWLCQTLTGKMEGNQLHLWDHFRPLITQQWCLAVHSGSIVQNQDQNNTTKGERAV